MKIDTNKCPICNRDMVDDGRNSNYHHLKPKCKKGTDVILIHKICHNKIHSIFTETELDKYYYTIDRLLENSDMLKFSKWVSKKPIEFYTKTKQHTRKRRR